MFHSFQDFEQEAKFDWRTHKDDMAQLKMMVNDISRQVEHQSSMRRLYHQLDEVNNTIKATCSEAWREPETTIWETHNPYATAYGPNLDTHGPYNSSHGPYNSTHGPYNISHGPYDDAHGPRQVHSSSKCYETEAHNSGLIDFPLCNQSLASQPNSWSTSFSKTFDSQSPTHLSIDEPIFNENLVANHIKSHDKIVGKLESIGTRLDRIVEMCETIFVQQNYTSKGPLDEFCDETTCQGGEELESCQPQKENFWFETNSDESTQMETNKEQGTLEEPSYVQSLPFNLQILFPLRLTHIDKSNEMEMKHPPTELTIVEPEEKEDDGTDLEVEASDKLNCQFTEVDLSPQLEVCLEKIDARKDNTPQLIYRIAIEPRKKIFKKDHNKHISRISLNHFWVNYDALRGRKVKIR